MFARDVQLGILGQLPALSHRSIYYSEQKIDRVYHPLRPTETQSVRDLLLCREIAAQQNHHACGELVK
jgi:hypothetical protein